MEIIDGLPEEFELIYIQKYYLIALVAIWKVSPALPAPAWVRHHGTFLKNIVYHIIELLHIQKYIIAIEITDYIIAIEINNWKVSPALPAPAWVRHQGTFLKKHILYIRKNSIQTIMSECGKNT